MSYDVELVLDGTTYRGTSHWPEDEVAGPAPATGVSDRPASRPP